MPGVPGAWGAGPAWPAIAARSTAAARAPPTHPRLPLNADASYLVLDDGNPPADYGADNPWRCPPEAGDTSPPTGVTWQGKGGVSWQVAAGQRLWGFRVTINGWDAEGEEWGPALVGWAGAYLRTYTLGGDGFGDTEVAAQVRQPAPHRNQTKSACARVCITTAAWPCGKARSSFWQARMSCHLLVPWPPWLQGLTCNASGTCTLDFSAITDERLSPPDLSADVREVSRWRVKVSAKALDGVESSAAAAVLPNV